jgi:hypothetical protein
MLVYANSAGRSDVQKEINGLHPAVSATFEVRVRYLVNTPKLAWSEPQAKKLQGAGEIYEIRFKANNIEYRPLGCFNTSEKEFIILVWAYKKQRVYSPAAAITTAQKRAKEIFAGNAKYSRLQIDGEDFPEAEE